MTEQKKTVEKQHERNSWRWSKSKDKFSI